MKFKYYIPLNLILLFILQILIQTTNCSSEKSISTFAYFSDDDYLFSTCSCYLGNKYYTCTSFHTFTGIASFLDPLPVISGKTYDIKKIKIEFVGDPFCDDKPSSIFDLHLKLNGVNISPLKQVGKWNCDCQCLKVENTTTNFPTSSYNFGGINTITTQVEHSTEACYQGYTIVIYYEEKISSPTKTPTRSHTPTPTKSTKITSTTPSRSPVPSPSILNSSPSSSDNFQCCVYVNQVNGSYDVTCVPNSNVCAAQENTVLVAHVPTNDCNLCFDM